MTDDAGPATQGASPPWPLGDLGRFRLEFPKGRLAAPPAGLKADPPGFEGVRLTGQADDGAPRSTASAAPPSILALSGGGASGAYGAGVLVGLTAAGARPDFRVVTGVSTGALIAPFAFLGSAWDERLTEAYTGPSAAEAIGVRALRAGVSGGLVAADALEALVARFVDTALIDAVGAQHRRGRRLLVATTNLDTLSTPVWDLGAIAAKGGDAARRLFIDVLAASASLPGLFAPRMIRVEADGVAYEEMHVDGGTASPLLLAPARLILENAIATDGTRGEVYAIINTTLEPIWREMPTSIIAILSRSFDLMLASSYQGALRSAAELCERHHLTLKVTSLPIDLGRAHWMRFDQRSMTRTFKRGVEMAETGAVWARHPPPG